MKINKFIVTIFFLTFSMSSVYACSCSRIGIFKCQKQSEFVFTGKVVEIKEIVTQEKVQGLDKMVDYRRFEFIFEIKAIHKGKSNFPSKSRITIITSGGGADCGNYFNINEKYLVYAYTETNKLGHHFENKKSETEFLSTNLCTRTKKIRFLTFWEQLILELT